METSSARAGLVPPQLPSEGSSLLLEAEFSVLKQQVKNVRFLMSAARLNVAESKTGGPIGPVLP